MSIIIPRHGNKPPHLWNAFCHFESQWLSGYISEIGPTLARFLDFSIKAFYAHIRRTGSHFIVIFFETSAYPSIEHIYLIRKVIRRRESSRIRTIMSKQSFNIGLIGYGLSAKIFHIPFVQAVHELKLYAIVQRRPRAGNDARQDHPQVKVYGSSAELVRDQNVDVVVVNTAPESHFALAKEALEARKHGTIEKTC